MNPAEDVCISLGQIDWFARAGCGENDDFAFGSRLETSRSSAIAGFSSDLWVEVRTEAQGDLTGYLARHRYDLYGSTWNDLVRSTRTLVASSARDAVLDALATHGFPVDWLETVLLDLTRAAVEAAYRRVVPKAPRFFWQLLVVYEHGRLPCGWDEWPSGSLAVY